MAEEHLNTVGANSSSISLSNCSQQQQTESTNVNLQNENSHLNQVIELEDNHADAHLGTTNNTLFMESRKSKSLKNASSMDAAATSSDIHVTDNKKTHSAPVNSEELLINCNTYSLSKSNMFENDVATTTTSSNHSRDNNNGLAPNDVRKQLKSPQFNMSVDSPVNDLPSSSLQIAHTIEHEDESMHAVPIKPNVKGTTIRRLRFDNERLQAEVTRLKRLIVTSASTVFLQKTKISLQSDNNVNNEVSSLSVLENELQLMKEAVISLKGDRRKLKAEKMDLLAQMKQLYATLEDKEKELREFIRNYEKRAKGSNESSIHQLPAEKGACERERWSLLKHARDEAERSLSLAAQLNNKELQLQQTQQELQQARRQLASNGSLSDQESIVSVSKVNLAEHSGNATPGGSCLGYGVLVGDRGSCSADSGVRVSSDRESGATSIGGNLSDSTTDVNLSCVVLDEAHNQFQNDVLLHSPPSQVQDFSPSVSPLNVTDYNRFIDSHVSPRSDERLSSFEGEASQSFMNRFKHVQLKPTGRGGTWGSISRVFTKSRQRNKAAGCQQENVEKTAHCFYNWLPLTEEGYAEKLRLLREASAVPMEQWRTTTVLAWLDVVLGMGQYTSRCIENAKSGKIDDLRGHVLLELSDLDLECNLGVTHPMHRKKLRLAIEEHRQPHFIRYPFMAQLSHTWVSSEWLPNLGLSQYSDCFTANMVDARMLEHLSKKELEKYLGVTRKFHQASIVHGIHLLRIVKYDRQTLAIRRHQCENIDADPLVWSNHRFIQWARSIDLSEYADNLKGSGVHGGLVVLEASFNADTMATALGIPSNKSSVRRHLTAELEALITPARSTLQQFIRIKVKTPAHTESHMERSFAYSCSKLSNLPLTGKNILSVDHLRSSLNNSINRAVGLIKITSSKKDKNSSLSSATSSSSSTSVVSRSSPTSQYYSTQNSKCVALSDIQSPLYTVPYLDRIDKKSLITRNYPELEMGLNIKHSIGSFRMKSQSHSTYLNVIDNYQIVNEDTDMPNTNLIE